MEYLEKKMLKEAEGKLLKISEVSTVKGAHEINHPLIFKDFVIDEFLDARIYFDCFADNTLMLSSRFRTIELDFIIVISDGTLSVSISKEDTVQDLLDCLEQVRTYVSITITGKLTGVKLCAFYNNLK